MPRSGGYNPRLMATCVELKSLSVPKQAQLLLARLAKFHPHPGNTFSAHNYERQPEDLAHGFPRSEARAVTELLLGAPWMAATFAQSGKPAPNTSAF